MLSNHITIIDDRIFIGLTKYNVQCRAAERVGAVRRDAGHVADERRAEAGERSSSSRRGQRTLCGESLRGRSAQVRRGAHPARAAATEGEAARRGVDAALSTGTKHTNIIQRDTDMQIAPIHIY